MGIIDLKITKWLYFTYFTAYRVTRNSSTSSPYLYPVKITGKCYATHILRCLVFEVHVTIKWSNTLLRRQITLLDIFKTICREWVSCNWSIAFIPNRYCDTLSACSSWAGTGVYALCFSGQWQPDANMFWWLQQHLHET